MRNLLNVRRVRIVAVSCGIAAFVGWSTGVLAHAFDFAQAGAGANAQAQGRGRDQGPPKPPDPREGLKPGITDAGTAAKAMQLVASLPKAEPFADPTGRGGLSFANSDLAFHGTTVVQGNFSGLTFFDVTDPTKPAMKTFVVCPGGQGDVSIYGHLLFMSVEATNGRLDCGATPATPPAASPAGGAPAGAPGGGRGRGQTPDPARFRGVRIFDITDLSKPKQVADVQTCRGSHTHTLVTDPKDKANIYIYGQGTAGVRPAEELAGCVNADPSVDPNTALFSIDVIKVPLAHPEQAAVVNRPRIFQDAGTGAINGLWQGGNHGAGTQTSGVTNQCHDITVYPAMGLAAGACSGNGILLDISDPVHPVRLDDVADPSFSYWHSASFNNDATKVLYTDEWGGGTAPRCRATDPLNWGGDAIFSLTNKRLKFAGYFKMPAVQTDTENCVAHNGSLIPIPGRDIKVQAWYQGGASIVDFTDGAHPVEIGYFDRGPLDATRLITGGFWCTYWYNGYIYGSEIARGFDIFKLVPSDLLTQNEIDAANLIHFDELNVQSQPHIVWPASFVVARAYLDQLARTKTLSDGQISDLNAAMTAFDAAAAADRKAAGDKLTAMAGELEKTATTAKPIDASRLKACAATIKGRVGQK